MTLRESREIVVVGGGLAGASVAARLAQAGADVLILEREPRAKPKVCGEFLNAESLRLLSEFGVDAFQLGAARIGRFCFEAANQTLASDLPQLSAGLSRLSLDEACLERALAEGAELRRDVTVTGLSHATAGGFCVRTQRKDVLARAVFWATGKHDVRSVQTRVGKERDVIGVKCTLLPSPGLFARLEGLVFLAFFSNGYAGINPVEAGRLNLCFIIHKDVIPGTRGFYDAALTHVKRQSDFLNSVLTRYSTGMTQPSAVANVPYGFIRSARSQAAVPGLYFVGDQFAVLPSFWGSGMTLALLTAKNASASYLRHGPAGSVEYEKESQSLIHSRLRLFLFLHRLMQNPRAAPALLRFLNRVPSVRSRLIALSRLPLHSPGPKRRIDDGPSDTPLGEYRV